VEAVRVYARYDLPDEKGETRRERNLRFGYGNSPEFEIPPGGEYLWELYVTLSMVIHRVDFNGYYYSFPPSEILAWCKLAKVDITSGEYEIISAMDNIFCNEVNEDRSAAYSRKLDEQKQEIEKKSKRRR
jgi:hypothetical protein